MRTGDLSKEQHRDLLEKLGQLYELQKWQRRRSIDMQAQHELGHPSFIPQPASHSRADDLTSMHSKPMISDMNNDQGRGLTRLTVGNCYGALEQFIAQIAAQF